MIICSLQQTTILSQKNSSQSIAVQQLVYLVRTAEKSRYTDIKITSVNMYNTILKAYAYTLNPGHNEKTEATLP